MSYVGVAGSLIMMVFGGIGIDMMYAEVKRAKIQGTLDRAVLAAASMENDLDPTSTVEEYFRAMGLEDTLSEVNVDETVVSKRVNASAQTTMPSNFLSLLGIDTLQASGLATAEEALSKLEISMVLDVSGSMSGNKLEQLKDASGEFIDLMLPPGNDGTVTISVVPYNATVNLGETLSDYYTLKPLHDKSHCATFEAAEFDDAAVSPAEELGQLAHFDPYGGSGRVTDPWCGAGNHNAVVPYSSDPATLKAHIQTFEAQGNTAIDLGVKWGTALLDPSAGTAVAQMAADGHVAPAAADRPAPYNDGETFKFIVVMTDGANTQQYDLPDSMKYDMSDVWVDDNGTLAKGDDRFSIRVVDNVGTSNDIWYWPHNGGWARGPYSHALGGAAPMVGDVAEITRDLLESIITPAGTGTTEPLCSPYHVAPDSDAADCASNVPLRLSNLELYAEFKTRWVAEAWYRPAYYAGLISWSRYNAMRTPYRTMVNANTADNRLSRICDAAKAEGIIVYAIGVEAPQRGLDAMQDCASSASHYFDVQGEDLTETFANIARSLVQLRLIQ
ncbi:Tad domain-containing protein [Pseudoponticoccus marisrubri]|uniref:Putative Flp pilus-assembly TadG-like N-terminal domain-containing protein n=1 Tax=Pseudoponticoccus marisrubri TaxID=1685382 RepID=A0A0W7WFC0_9RHOB|nr:Tad domain-containing protein [Pseudoponticoccus marisrubri]KUF09250.1 hypothetical protein AVJ23_18525 [Pseudoponticoccus marisrubri]